MSGRFSGRDNFLKITQLISSYTFNLLLNTRRKANPCRIEITFED
jgi:hypothetical protein